MKTMKVAKIIAVSALLGGVAIPSVFASDKVDKGVAKTEKGVDKAADKTGDGVDKAAKGSKKALKKTKDGTKKFGSRIKGLFKDD